MKTIDLLWENMEISINVHYDIETLLRAELSTCLSLFHPKEGCSLLYILEKSPAL